ncbi:MAG: fatty acid hydroxylase [Alphaproteobacteria bacterium]|nr:fatty acid hydroxylase [Alphaproteobacteria bacterium]
MPAVFQPFEGLSASDFANFPAIYLQIATIIWARYFVIAGAFMFLLWGRPPEKVSATRLAARRPTRPEFQHEITMSIISSAIYAIAGALVFLAWQAGGTAIYADIGGVAGIAYIPASILFYLFLHDTYFYWTHRAMHTPALFRATHLTHHKSRQPTAWAAFSFHPWEAAISAWLLPLTTFFVPIHEGAVLFLLVFMTYCSVANHAGWEVLPRRWLETPVGRRLITASHHNVHHTNYRTNYGLYFRFWDLLCGTDRGLAEPAGPLPEGRTGAVADAAG